MTLLLGPMKSWPSRFKYSVSFIVSEIGGEFGNHNFLPLLSLAIK